MCQFALVTARVSLCVSVCLYGSVFLCIYLLSVCLRARSVNVFSVCACCYIFVYLHMCMYLCQFVYMCMLVSVCMSVIVCVCVYVVREYVYFYMFFKCLAQALCTGDLHMCISVYFILFV